MVSKGKAVGRLWAEPAQLWDKAARGRWGQPCQRPAGQFPAVTRSPPQVEKPIVDIQSLLGAWHPTPSMWAQGSGPCAFVLVAWLLGTVHSLTLISESQGPEPPAPQNSTGIPAASLQRLSVWGPFLGTLWTLVALSSLLGKHTVSVQGLHSCSRSKPLEAYTLVPSTELFWFCFMIP